uniref:Uncharacterized protein n=1 Tax=Oryza sativa subsp. japonica TaxID=39947 RepID=Q8H3Q2_ORYSJ|nr:hypothetical protein [Oryza sativa Japonica Group]
MAVPTVAEGGRKRRGEGTGRQGGVARGRRRQSSGGKAKIGAAVRLRSGTVVDWWGWGSDWAGYGLENIWTKLPLANEAHLSIVLIIVTTHHLPIALSPIENSNQSLTSGL